MKHKGSDYKEFNIIWLKKKHKKKNVKYSNALVEV